MDMMHTVVEAVFVSFFVGAIMGAVVALHLSSKQRTVQSNDETLSGDLELKRVKVKANNGRDRLM